jgi:hypothetical protein
MKLGKGVNLQRFPKRLQRAIGHYSKEYFALKGAENG